MAVSLEFYFLRMNRDECEPEPITQGGGLGHCDKCDNPRMTYVTCYPDLVTLCEEHR